MFISIRSFKEIFPYKKQRVLRFTYNFFLKKSVVFIENALCFKCYWRPTPTFAGYLSFTRYEWENRKSDNSQFPIILIVVMNFSASCFFCITVWRASKEHSNCFETKSNLKSSPLTSKATSGYFGQSVWNWIKGNVPFPLKKADLTGTMKASPNLPAGAGTMPVSGACRTIFFRILYISGIM